MSTSTPTRASTRDHQAPQAAGGLPEPKNPPGTERQSELPGTPGTQPTPQTVVQSPTTEGERKPAEDSFFSERDAEMREEQQPPRRHHPRHSEQ